MSDCEKEFERDYEKLFYTVLNTTEKIARELHELHETIGGMYYDLHIKKEEAASITDNEKVHE